MPDIERGKPVHCVETVTDRNLTGMLLLSGDEIRVDLYSYTDPFQINVDQPIYLLAETGDIISLHANIDSSSGSVSGQGPTIYHHGFISNVAVVGHDRWTDTDKVKYVSFTVEHAMELLRHKDKVKAIGSTRHPEEENFTILKEAASGLTLSAHYSAIYEIGFNAPKELWPVFVIEFDEPKSILDYIEHVLYYVDFLSFCLGVKLKPDKINIDRLSHDEMMAAAAARAYRGHHKVQYVWPEEKIESRDLWVGGSPVRAWDENELNTLRACLVAWINRAESWKKPYVMMTTSFALKSVISAERLINACRWFEDIPITQSQNALSDEHIEAIAAAATQKAEELGHAPIIRKRIEGSIRRLKAESSKERFTRLVAKIEEKFGKGILPENAVMHLKRAIEFRGKTAHGHFNPKSDEELSAFCTSIRAMEALCYLLTALDLPISAEGLKRVRSNPVVRDYRLTDE